MKQLITKSIFSLLLFFTFQINTYADPYGTLLGSFNNVNCYSNGTTGYVSNNSNYYNGTNTGMTWQCPEICNRYYVVNYQMNIRNQTYNNANNYYPTANARGLSSFPNGSNTIPKTGDIITFTGGTNGHMGIIRAVGSNYVDVIQQNWSNNASDVSQRLTMNINNGNYTIANLSSSYFCQSWLRKINTTGFGAVSSGIFVSPDPVRILQSFNVNFTLKETQGLPITFQTISCAILDNNNNFKFDIELRNNVTIPPNGTYTYNVNSTQFGSGTIPGIYKAVARGRVLNGSWFDFQTTGAGQNPKLFTVSNATLINLTINSIPTKFNLYQNFPNPFNPETNIKFDVSKSGNVTVKILDILGREIETLINEHLNSGSYKLTYNGIKLSSGIYIIRLSADEFSDIKKITLVK